MTFYTIARSVHDEGIGFTSVHQMMDYFRYQILEDFNTINEGKDINLLAVLSRAMNPELNFSFKTISAGKKSLRAVYKQLFPNTAGYVVGWGIKTLNSVPQNYRILVKWEEGENCLIPNSMSWKDFFDENCKKENPILSKEDLIYTPKG